MSKYYAVKKGVTPGIYTNWDHTKLQVNGFKGAVYKSFKTEQEATLFMNDKNIKNVEKNKDKKIVYTVPKNIDILAYTDGSCKNKIGGYGLVLIVNPQSNILNNLTFEDSGPIESPCTNQIAEIYAINRTLTHLLEYKTQRIMIRTDSQFCIDCFTGYINTWKKNGFLLTDKTPVKNQQLIKDTYELYIQFTKLSFEHIYSHCGEPYNEIVDKLAGQYTCQGRAFSTCQRRAFST
jgi:ribonuclease HI